MSYHAKGDFRSHRSGKIGDAGRPSSMAAALICCVLILGQAGCFWKKKKTALPPAVPAGPARMVLLPLNPPADDAELRWISLAVPVMMARLGTAHSDLELVPLWQTMPIAVESAGPSRTITPEVAAYVASRVGARWATNGELSPAKGGIDLLIDFIPTKSWPYPFRFHRGTSVSSLEPSLQQAYNGFLEYLTTKEPSGKSSGGSLDGELLKAVAAALDKEYGWYEPAQPGRSENVVARLALADRALARMLFNPTLYPSLGGQTAPKARAETAPSTAALPPPEKQRAAGAESRAAPSAPSEPDRRKPAPEIATPQPARSEIPTEALVLPSKIFSLRLGGVSGPEAPADAEAARSGSASDRSKAAQAIRAGPRPASKSEAVAARQAPSPARPAPKLDRQPDSIPPPIRIQVSSSRSRKNAEIEADRLAKAGLKTEIQEIDLSENGIWYRVHLPGFRTRRAATETATALQGKGLIREFWLLR